MLKHFEEFEKLYIYSAPLHQDSYRKSIKRFHNFIPINIIPSILNDEVIDLVIDELVIGKKLKNQIHG